MVDTVCEALNYIVSTIVVLAIDLRCFSLCSKCIMKSFTDMKVFENSHSQSFSAGGLYIILSCPLEYFLHRGSCWRNTLIHIFDRI